MATFEQLSAALIKADAAGNTADAKAIADAIRQMREAESVSAAPSQTTASSEIPGPRAGGLAVFGRRVASAADVLAGDIPSAIVQQVAYPVARAFTTPERATQISQTVSEPIRQPFGRAFGVTQTPEYQTEASRELMGFIGENIGKGVKWLSQQTGLPEADVANMVGSATFAAPELNRLRPRVDGKLSQAVGSLAAGIPASISGKPVQAYKEALASGMQNKKAFVENLRGNVAPDDILAAMQQGISKMRDDASTAYVTAKTGWAADTKALDFSKIDQAYANVKASLEQRGKSKIGKEEQAKVAEIGAVLDEWRSDPTARTALDFDALKQRIDAIYPDSPKHNRAENAIRTVRNAVKDEITQNVSGYADAMKNYEIQRQLLEDINKGLSSGDRVAKEATLNKIMGALKDTPSAEMRRELLDVIKQQTGVDVMPAIAGQELRSWTPKSGFGRAALGGGLTSAVVLRHPEIAAVLPLTSPRLMGELYYGAGRLGGLSKRGVNALATGAGLRNLNPAQEAYFNSLLMGAGQQQQTKNKLVAE